MNADFVVLAVGTGVIVMAGLGRERLETVERELVVVGGPRAAQPCLDRRAVALGQVLEHVSLLVTDAALHRHGAEHFVDGRAQRLAAIEDDEHALLDIQAAVHEV